jgi:hypothetical protein
MQGSGVGDAVGPVHPVGDLGHIQRVEEPDRLDAGLGSLLVFLDVLLAPGVARGCQLLLIISQRLRVAAGQSA